MNIYNIRIIANQNTYTGSIFIDERKTILGVCADNNYDKEGIITGQLSAEGIYLEIKILDEVISILAKKSKNFPKKSIAKANYFIGKSLNSKNDILYIEIINFKDIKQKLTNTSKKLELVK